MKEKRHREFTKQGNTEDSGILPTRSDTRSVSTQSRRDERAGFSRMNNRSRDCSILFEWPTAISTTTPGS
ncbi:hypothetical protein WG66_007929 [Moniliophthora roreri]|nr:hypothetical protein WG66_007929 [Moniliophthora roreri]